MEKLRATPLRADLNNVRVLTEGMQDCAVVYHLARYFDFWSADNAFHRINCIGTRNVMAAAAAAGVRRVVLCSSALTIGEPPGTEGSEFTRHRGETYTELERSLLAAEQLALEAREKGVQVVIVNPGLILAPNDPGWTGRLLTRYLAGDSWFAFDAPMGWVHVNDAVRALLAAAERGEDGARYIVSGATMSPRDLLTIVGQLTRRSRPMPLSGPFARIGAVLARSLTNPQRRPRLSLDEARFGTTGFRVDGSHARHSLELEYTPVSRYLPPVVESYRNALSRFEN